MLTSNVCGFRHVRVVPSPSPPLTACDVLSTSDPVRRSGLTECPPPSAVASQAVVSTAVQLQATMDSVQLPNLSPESSYDVWVIAADLSIPPNIQATPFLLGPVTTEPCASCLPGWQIKSTCTNHHDTLCEPPVSQLSCEPGWSHGLDRTQCVKASPMPVPGSEAAIACSDIGGSLASALSIAWDDLDSECQYPHWCWTQGTGIALQEQTFAWARRAAYWTSDSISHVHDPQAHAFQIYSGTRTQLIHRTSNSTVHLCSRARHELDSRVPMLSRTPCSQKHHALCIRAAYQGVRARAVALQCSGSGCTASSSFENPFPMALQLEASTLAVQVRTGNWSTTQSTSTEVFVDGMVVARCQPWERVASSWCNSSVWLPCVDQVRVAATPTGSFQVAMTTSAASEPSSCKSSRELTAAMHLLAATVEVPSSVHAWVRHVRSGVANIGWRWPISNGGSPLDQFSVTAGTTQVNVSIDEPKLVFARLMQASQAILETSVHGVPALLASCPLNQVIVWGISVHLPLGSQERSWHPWNASAPSSGAWRAGEANMSRCEFERNKACTPRQRECAQSRCESSRGSAYRFIWMVCQTPAAIPSWVSAQHVLHSFTTDASLDASHLTCPAETRFMLGFHLVQPPGSVWPMEEAVSRAQSCARSHTVTCSTSSSSCLREKCPADVPPMVALGVGICVPVEVALETEAETGDSNSISHTCRPNHVTAMGLVVGDAATMTESELLSATKVCPTKRVQCNLLSTSLRPRMFTAACVSPGALIPEMQLSLPPLPLEPVAIRVSAISAAGYESLGDTQASPDIYAFGVPDSCVPMAPSSIHQTSTTGGSLNVEWSSSSQIRACLPNEYVAQLFHGKCVAPNLPASPSSLATKAIIHARVSLEPSGAAGNPTPRWEGKGYTTSGQKRVHARFRGAVSGWRTVGRSSQTPSVDARTTHISPTSNLLGIAAVKLAFPWSELCSTGLGVAEVRIWSWARVNIAPSATVSSTSVQSLHHTPAVVVDGWDHLDEAVPTVWRPQCNGSTNEVELVFTLNTAATLRGFEIIWSQQVDRFPLVTVQVSSSISGSLLAIGDAAGAIRLGFLESSSTTVVQHSTAELWPSLFPPFRVPPSERTGAASIEIWLRTTAITVQTPVLCDGWRHLHLGIGGDMSIMALSFHKKHIDQNSFEWFQALSSTATILPNVWHHVVVVRGNNLAEGHPAIFVDGTLVASWHIETYKHLVVVSDMIGRFRTLRTHAVNPTVWEVGPTWVRYQAGRAHTSAALSLGDTVVLLQPALGASTSWQDFDITLELNATQCLNSTLMSISFRYRSDSSFSVLRVQPWLGTMELCGVRHGSISCLHKASLNYLSWPNISIHIRIVAVGNKILVEAQGFGEVFDVDVSASLMEQTTVAPPGSMSVAFSVLEGQSASVRLVAAVELAPRVVIGPNFVNGSSTWIDVGLMQLHDWELPANVTRLLSQSFSSLPTASRIIPEHVWNVSDLTTWSSPAHLVRKRCDLCLDFSRHTTTVLTGLSPGETMELQVSPKGVPHHHVWVHAVIGYEGPWEAGDKVEMLIDEEVVWTGYHQAPNNCSMFRGNWTHLDGFCYTSPDAGDSVTWDEAERKCHSAHPNASVWTADTGQETDAVLKHFDSSVWTGLRDTVREGVYASGNAALYGHFQADPPYTWSDTSVNGNNGLDMDCVSVGLGGKLSSVRCSDRFPVICRIAVPRSRCGASELAVSTHDIDVITRHTGGTATIRFAMSSVVVRDRIVQPSLLLVKFQTAQHRLRSPGQRTLPTLAPLGEVVVGREAAAWSSLDVQTDYCVWVCFASRRLFSTHPLTELCV